MRSGTRSARGEWVFARRACHQGKARVLTARTPPFLLPSRSGKVEDRSDAALFFEDSRASSAAAAAAAAAAASGEFGAADLWLILPRLCGFLWQLLCGCRRLRGSCPLIL